MFIHFRGRKLEKLGWTDEEEEKWGNMKPGDKKEKEMRLVKRKKWEKKNKGQRQKPTIKVQVVHPGSVMKAFTTHSSNREVPATIKDGHVEIKEMKGSGRDLRKAGFQTFTHFKDAAESRDEVISALIL